jgi:hypothetical protein
VSQIRVYRTEQGTIFRTSQGEEGRLSVELLSDADAMWISGPIGMAGLRLDPSTTKLTQRQVEALPR